MAIARPASLLVFTAVVCATHLAGAMAAPARALLQANAGEGDMQGNNPPTAQKRYTLDGEECLFPVTVRGREFNDCVDLTGSGVLFCPFDPSNPYKWKACADPSQGSGNVSVDASSVQPIYARDGQKCTLPLQYNGAEVDNCVSIEGKLGCWGEATQQWVECSDLSTLDGPDPADRGLGLSTAASTVLMVPVVARNTTDGTVCNLPSVYQGQILDDCVDRNGVPSCPDSEGSWHPCDLAPPKKGQQQQPLMDEQGLLIVADRMTVGGEECLFPAVYGDYVWFDCANYFFDGSQGLGLLVGMAEICPIANGTWDVCAPVESSSEHKAFSVADTVVNRTAPGSRGQLCSLVPDESAPESGCAEDDAACFPLPDLGGNVSLALQGIGFCRPEPAGGTFGVYKLIAEEGLPRPLAHFPLTGETAGSILLPAYNGGVFTNKQMPSWVDDDKFASVLKCNRTEQDLVVLDNVPYGVEGDFTVNLWMRRLPDSDTSGKDLQYLFSHSGVSGASMNSPNQVQLYLGDDESGAPGLVRAIVMDSSDNQNKLVYLDSDGKVNCDINCTRGQPRHGDLNDGEWHMITLSTLPDGTKGYMIYVDGKQAAALSASNTEDVDPQEFAATGGDPALMSYYITLCSRADFNPRRFYDGSIAHLMLFDAALEPAQVNMLYQQIKTGRVTLPSGGGSGDSVESASRLIAPSSDATVQPATEVTTSSDSSSSDSSSSGGGSDAGLIAGIVIAVVVGTVLLAALIAFVVVRKRRQPAGTGSFSRYQANGPSPPPSELGALGAAGAVQMSEGRRASSRKLAQTGSGNAFLDGISPPPDPDNTFAAGVAGADFYAASLPSSPSGMTPTPGSAPATPMPLVLLPSPSSMNGTPGPLARSPSTAPGGAQ